jgi:hypothetical protein
MQKPQIRYVEHERYAQLDDKLLEDLASIGYHIIGYNPVYADFIDNTSSYEALYGGRGGAKSEMIQIRDLVRCIELPYFRRVALRKVAAKVKESIYDTYIELIERYYFDKYFKVNKTTKTISCTINKNKIFMGGMDKPKKFKSFRNPTAIWLEEAEEFELLDFTTADESLRTPEASFLQMTVSFNPYYEGVWIRDNLLEGTYGFKEWKTTYNDNLFIDREAYYNRLINNQSKDRQYVNLTGNWGKGENVNTWLHRFDETIHISTHAVYQVDMPVYYFLDFNYEKFCAIIVQASRPDKLSTSFFYVIGQIVLEKAGIEEMVHAIHRTYPNAVKYVGGDQTAASNTVNGNALGTLRASLKIPTSSLLFGEYNRAYDKKNPSHHDSWEHCNNALMKHPNFAINPSCTDLISDLRIARFDERKMQTYTLFKMGGGGQWAMNSLDCLRYGIHTLLPSYKKIVI